ncbi:Sec-independent protein translocase protein TatB [Hoeflea sp.]|uniref:Sec-independent protein translocase protein TatB n=1 Tax=Hoeflea sp. TaxID=1940281 RepID=UPI0019985036|nr:Sec-independent protein translocase protein TatB [Hoeflea sp.]MBC7280766.1 twin-arginine translocase subunit TatB [Hoeflea sp.]
MFDIGWPELLVVAIVLIIVVGPKDLPPMLRAFGRTTKKLRGMANEFRGQFDEALREAELDDVKKTFDEARKLNPMQTIRDAVNPLKDTAKSIRSDIEKTVNAPSETPAWKPKTEIPEATMKLPDGAPEVKPTEPASTASQPEAKAASKASPASKTGAKPASTAARTAKAPSKAKAETPKPASKPATPKTASVATPAAKAPAKAKPKAAAAGTKAAPRARKPKQGEGQA